MNMEEGKRSKQQEPLRFLVVAASARQGSLNAKLAQLAANVIVKKGAVAELKSISVFECPSFNHDLEKSSGIPAGAERLRKSLLDNDAFVIASPEYNGSMPGNLKNIIDWVSRFRPQPFNERHALLMSASPSMAGGNRGLWSLRIPLEHLGTRVYPDMFSLAAAHQAFTNDDQISNEVLAKRFEANLDAFMSLAEASKHYPCMKKAWVEFLGENPDPVTERVEA
jgi:chromate reductase, NAD(P)H dehydrogenase (quinone)